MPIDSHEITHPRKGERYVTVHNIRGENVGYSTARQGEEGAPSLIEQVREVVKDLPEGDYLATRIYTETDIDRVGLTCLPVTIRRPATEIEIG